MIGRLTQHLNELKRKIVKSHMAEFFLYKLNYFLKTIKIHLSFICSVQCFFRTIYQLNSLILETFITKFVWYHWDWSTVSKCNTGLLYHEMPVQFPLDPSLFIAVLVAINLQSVLFYLKTLLLNYSPLCFCHSCFISIYQFLIV